MTSDERIASWASWVEQMGTLATDIRLYVSDMTEDRRIPLFIGVAALSVASSTGIRALALSKAAELLPPEFWHLLEDDLRQALEAVEAKK